MGIRENFMRKVYFILPILIVVFLFIRNIQYPIFNVQRQKQTEQKTLQSLTVGDETLSVEVVQTPDEITLGLGERDTLGSDGMLFVMSDRSIPAFWMKGMRFDLDFVWIDGDIVIDITENVKAEPSVPLYQLKTYSPRAPVTYVLELNAGDIAKKGIKIGDAVKLSEG